MTGNQASFYSNNRITSIFIWLGIGLVDVLFCAAEVLPDCAPYSILDERYQHVLTNESTEAVDGKVLTAPKALNFVNLPEGCTYPDSEPNPLSLNLKYNRWYINYSSVYLGVENFGGRISFLDTLNLRYNNNKLTGSKDDNSKVMNTSVSKYSGSITLARIFETGLDVGYCYQLFGDAAAELNDGSSTAKQTYPGIGAHTISVRYAPVKLKYSWFGKQDKVSSMSAKSASDASIQLKFTYPKKEVCYCTISGSLVKEDIETKDTTTTYYPYLKVGLGVKPVEWVTLSGNLYYSYSSTPLLEGPMRSMGSLRYLSYQDKSKQFEKLRNIDTSVLLIGLKVTLNI